ncbi:TetR/AcrR family transcriptional regulator [Pseudohalioglobus sediminis]|uniref:TetR/AcrR family transcriptional regulator n=1 Tax=Pseudohalioglobus sediminis TaxID=2606449 RepID=A0A5B0X469_9GAMM|nr:TetR/AcrR family transcriptional regulator [Pseudohalioglobus sediminis]KAA1194124.1 TetR/AcrR family transcriptional regulator [Pseudohalioglobus sediminis]
MAGTPDTPETTLSKHEQAKRPLWLKKRAAILDSAEQLFLEDGFAGVPIDRISEVSGISKTTIYKHFGAKEALFREVIERKVSALSDKINRPDPQAAAEEQLLALARATAAVLMDPDFMALHRMMLAAPGDLAELIRWQYEVGMQSLLTTIAQVIEGLSRHGEIHFDALDLAVQDFLSLTQGAGGSALRSGGTGTASSIPEPLLRRGVANFLKIYGRS